MGGVKDVLLRTLDHVEAQARAGVRHRTGRDLWAAAVAFAPEVFPPGLVPDVRVPDDRDLLRDLAEAHAAGLPAVAIGCRVRVPGEAGERAEGTVTALPDDGLLVRFHYGPMPEGRHSSACTRCRQEPRIAVDLVQ